MELIETLWNVNMNRYIPITPECIELIETLWNVNNKSMSISVSCSMN